MDKQKKNALQEKEPSPSRVIGIDLGTSNSLISYIKNGSPRIIPNERGERMTPSVVHFKENGEVVVGQMAKNQAVINSHQTISLVKLAMGTDQMYTVLNRQYSPVDISCHILTYLKKSAETYLGHPVSRSVITVPAYFNDRQREDTLKSAEKAGLTVLKLLNEPTAAALVYGFNREKDTRLLVIDLGGGTLDITLMAYEDNIFQVKGVGGSTTIGGAAFDRLIVQKIIHEFSQVHDIDLKKDLIAHQQLIINAEKAKIDLSSAEDTQILIPYITVTPKGPIHLNTSLSRKEFEELTTDIFKTIAGHIQQTFQEAQIETDWVETVILVGGSTRVPALEKLVRQIICHEDKPSSDKTSSKAGSSEPEKNEDTLILTSGTVLEKELKRNINPDEAVARGAGLMAGIMEGNIEGIEFHDITPHDLGIEDDQGSFIPIIPRGKAYPATARHMVTNTHDNQENVVINVLQRMDMNAEKLLSLGWFQLSIDPGKKQHQASIDVVFSIDGNGILEVTAIDLDTGDQKAITITTEKMLLCSSHHEMTREKIQS